MLREVHPELSFALWAGAPMKHRKTTAAGLEERQALIATRFGKDAFARARASVRGHGVATDDVADAFAAAWSAARIASETATRFPDQRHGDARGIPMNIWA
jgi:predicted RNase H-like nuclease